MCNIQVYCVSSHATQWELLPRFSLQPQLVHAVFGNEECDDFILHTDSIDIQG